MKLPVTYYGNPILRKEGSPIIKIDDSIRKLAQDMLETMYEEEGLGIAAQQVDQALLITVIDLQDSRAYDNFYTLDGKSIPSEVLFPLVLINPSIESFSEDLSDYDEGCLSFPDIRGLITRPTSIKLTYQDLDGVQHSLECSGLLSRCIQHEYDHLKGILFIDRMSARQREALKSKLKRLKRSTQADLKKKS